MLGASYHFTLLVLRITGNSSLHRLARVQQLPTPSAAKDALKILGDQEDHAWPGPSCRFWDFQGFWDFKGDSFSFGSGLEAIQELRECLSVLSRSGEPGYLETEGRIRPYTVIAF